MSGAGEKRNAAAVEKVEQLMKELQELGFATTFFYRAPASARGPVGHLLIGECPEDVEAARGA